MRKRITKREFLDDLKRRGLISGGERELVKIVPCECDDERCRGWRMEELFYELTAGTNT